jgi:hypothetical protein
LTVAQTDKVAIAAPKAKAKPAPVEEVEDAEEVAPVVKKAREVEKPAAESPDKDAKIRALIEELGDDEDEE